MPAPDCAEGDTVVVAVVFECAEYGSSFFVLSVENSNLIMAKSNFKKFNCTMIRMRLAAFDGLGPYNPRIKRITISKICRIRPRLKLFLSLRNNPVAYGGNRLIGI
jgi:hypothetical protein